MSSKILIGLAGNPNVGKSTIFNALAGEHQHTGNWPGKTVEKVEGYLFYNDKDITIFDLPGTYSLSAHSPEEVIARDFIVKDAPNVIIDVVDATLLERNLNLILQILELTDQVVLALNFMDEVQERGFTIDIPALEKEVGIPVVPIIARDGKGINKLMEEALAVADKRKKTHPIQVDYGITLERAIQQVETKIRSIGIDGMARWIALKILEDDVDISSAFQSGKLLTTYMMPRKGSPYESLVAEKSKAELISVLEVSRRLGEGMTPDSRVEIVRRRYETAHRIAHKTVQRTRVEKVTLTEKLDRIVTHKFWAWPTMFAVFSGIFWMTIEGSNIPSKLLESGFNLLAYNLRLWLTSLNAPWWVTGSLIDGVIFGVGTVISVMLPPMVIFFILFALMEDFGFIPRVAFNLDKIMQATGSQGKQCLTCMMSYGCNIVGVMSSRIIDNEKDRLVSILTSPLIICNGRFGPSIALTILLFGEYALPVMLSLVLLSLIAYFSATLILNKTFLRHEPTGFMLELPPYRRPQIGKLVRRALVDRVAHVMIRAIQIAAPATLLIWIMGNVPPGQPFEKTLIGVLVNGLSPLGQPWHLDGEMIAALLFTLPAKEIVVPSLAMTYGLQTNLAGSGQILAFISSHWSLLSAYAFLVFYTLYLPCLATLWAIWKETRSLKWTILSLIVSLLTAMIITALVYTVGSALGY
jgi:ferrous iron transport protein B